MKLQEKITITGTITTVTGLHIGGSKSTIEIGGMIMW
jgi:CRISPR/Cas system CSM-associated protein Csm3 (group 7 of RAMP superfamily)